MIELKQIRVQYQDTLALEDVSLRLEKSGIIGIIGPNGAGKSTLLKAMLGILPHSGEAYLDGSPLSQALGKIAYVEQKINIDYNFPITVKECVSLGLYASMRLFQKLSQADWQRVDKALSLVGLGEYANRQISQLSGGQFQRVLIARCLVQEGDYIFLDEPFVGIDSVSEDIIMQTLRKLQSMGKTILIVHHDLGKVPTYFDQVLLLNKRVIAFGDTKTTFTPENLQQTYGSGVLFQGGVA